MKNIVVAYDGSPGARAALEHATALAARESGHVTAVLAHAANEYYATKGAWIPEEARKIIASVNHRLVIDIQARFKSDADRLDLGDALSFEEISGKVDDALARRVRAADLLVLPRPSDSVDSHLIMHPDQIALQSGRPILMVGEENPKPDANKPVVVAWDGKRAAARALADALPLCHVGQEIVVLTVGEDVLTRPATEVVTHLGRHGLNARHVSVPQTNRVADAIIEHCETAQAGLLVMGAYEHSKFRVDLSGGPTFEILRRATWPVLMSH